MPWGVSPAGRSGRRQRWWRWGLLAIVLWRLGPLMAGVSSSDPLQNKPGMRLDTPVSLCSGCRGGYQKRTPTFSGDILPQRCFAATAGSFLRAEHMAPKLGVVIIGRKGGPSSTSSSEASSRIGCRSSTLRRHQVVCPRWYRGGLQLWFIVGAEFPSALLSDLGGDALRSPTIRGGGTQGPDCVLSFCSRVLFVISRALSSNNRFLVRVLFKGPSCNMYLPRFI
jgi:hypothetical protein